MDKDYRSRLESFIASKLMAEKLLKEGIISKIDYDKFLIKLQEKYCIKDSVIISY